MDWKVEYQGPMRKETVFFNDRMAAQRFADAMEARTYRTRPVVTYIGKPNHMTATFAMGPL